MKQIISKSKIRIFFIPILILLLFVRCDDETTDFPYVHVDATIYIDTQLGNINEGEHAFVDGYGVGGLIIFRETQTTYLAFDRACTYEANSGCKLEADTFYGILVCPCCGSKFVMLGEDQAGTIYAGFGPAKSRLIEYNVYFNGLNTLIVQN